MLPVDEQKSIGTTVEAIQRLQSQANRLVHGTGPILQALLDAIRFGVSLEVDHLELARPGHGDDTGAGGIN
jgi:hypothetical protein